MKEWKKLKKNTEMTVIAHNPTQNKKNTRGKAKDEKEHRQQPTTDKQSKGPNTYIKILTYKLRKEREGTPVPVLFGRVCSFLCDVVVCCCTGVCLHCTSFTLMFCVFLNGWQIINTKERRYSS